VLDTAVAVYTVCNSSSRRNGTSCLDAAPVAGGQAFNIICNNSEIDAVATDGKIRKQVTIGGRNGQSVRCHVPLASQALHVFSSTGKPEHQSRTMSRPCNDSEYTSFFSSSIVHYPANSATLDISVLTLKV